MARSIRALSPENETRLFDAVTGRRCECIADVADGLGSTVSAARHLMLRQRKAAIAGLSWWTIPHTPPGGARLYKAIEAQSGDILSADDRDIIMRGHLSSLRSCKTEMENGAKAYEWLSDGNYLPLPMRAACMAQAMMLTQMVSQMGGIIQMLVNGQMPLPVKVK